MPNKSYVPSIGQAGGIILLWKYGFCLEIVNSSTNMFHALITNDPARGEWFLSCVYGTPYRDDQPTQWQYINNLSKVVNILWVLMGDLNITFDLSERNTNTNPTSDEVIDLIKDAELHDLGFSGSTRTWKFFEHWLQNDTCLNEIKNAWVSNTSGSSAFIMNDKLSNTRHILSKWSKNIYENIQGRISALQDQITQLQFTDIQGSNTEEVLNLEKKIDSLNDIQASSYRQKSKDHYYNDMDKNSKYFQIRANQIRARNRIDSLQAPDGLEIK
ncbi:uncharacterized protein LOC113344029 [Papaver somniferum]|uniref:uncharacterized protein LOC113344029 n=1 Tax=Papaver somniferum TaxID=3469 RepID=UPI000E6FC289|nr:uncharacterized protein LOC113344029 [Papaver somniferum]